MLPARQRRLGPLARRLCKEHFRDVSIAPVVGKFLSNSKTVVCWVVERDMALCFGFKAPREYKRHSAFAPGASSNMIQNTCWTRQPGSSSAENLARLFVPQARVPLICIEVPFRNMDLGNKIDDTEKEANIFFTNPSLPLRTHPAPPLPPTFFFFSSNTPVMQRARCVRIIKQ